MAAASDSARNPCERAASATVSTPSTRLRGRTDPSEPNTVSTEG